MTDHNAVEIDRCVGGGAADELAAEIRRSRIAARLSQRQLAAEIDYTRQYVSSVERAGGNPPSLELARALDARRIIDLARLAMSETRWRVMP